MTDNEKEFVKKVNIDKAKKKAIKCVVLSIISLLSYGVPLVFGDIDFGMYFEIATLVFIFMAISNMINYDIDRSKRYIILAMIPIGWLLIYDIITIISYTSNVIDFTYLGINFVLQEGITIIDLLMLFAANKDLRKADNPEKYKESTDWFYERLDENGDTDDTDDSEKA